MRRMHGGDKLGATRNDPDVVYSSTKVTYSIYEGKKNFE